MDGCNASRMQRPGGLLGRSGKRKNLLLVMYSTHTPLRIGVPTNANASGTARRPFSTLPLRSLVVSAASHLCVLCMPLR